MTDFPHTLNTSRSTLEQPSTALQTPMSINTFVTDGTVPSSNSPPNSQNLLSSTPLPSTFVSPNADAASSLCPNLSWDRDGQSRCGGSASESTSSTQATDSTIPITSVDGFKATTAAMMPSSEPPRTPTNVSSTVPTPKPVDTAVASARTQQPKSDVSTGALAGVAIACFIVGLITAALILWAFRLRRHRGRPNGLSSSAISSVAAGSSNDSSHTDHKYLPMLPVATKASDKSLPPAAEPGRQDRERDISGIASPLAASQVARTAVYPPSSFAIKRKRVSATSTSALTGRSVDISDRSFSELRTQVKALFEQIEMHVDNFYTEASGLPLTDDYRHNLQQVDSPYLPDSIIGLLPEVEGSQIKPLIKHCLAYAIFSRIGGSSTHVDNDDILLPSGLAAITQAIYPLPTTRANNPEAYEQYLDRLLVWKHETVAMMDVHAVAKSANMQSKISKLAWKCVKGLEPWSLPRYGIEAKKSHLVRAIEEAVELGLRVFGEKKGWLVWQWEQNPIDTRDGAKVGDFVLFPGLDLRREVGNGRAGLRTDGESDRNVGGIGSAREVVLAPTMASI